MCLWSVVILCCTVLHHVLMVRCCTVLHHVLMVRCYPLLHRAASCADGPVLSFVAPCWWCFVFVLQWEPEEGLRRGAAILLDQFKKDAFKLQCNTCKTYAS